MCFYLAVLKTKLLNYPPSPKLPAGGHHGAHRAMWFYGTVYARVPRSGLLHVWSGSVC